MGGKKMFFGGKKLEPNTFIGGIAKLGGTGANAPILTAAELAVVLGISESIIDVFKVSGEDVECLISEGFTTKLEAFRQNSNIIFFKCDILTSVGDYAFTSCSSLVSVNFPLVTSVGYWAFGYCSSLVSVNFPLVTSVGDNSLSSCSSLVSVNFPLVTSVGYNSFGGCTSLTSIDFPLLTSIGEQSFVNCYSLVSVNFPLVTSVGLGAFYNCSSFEIANIKKCKLLGESVSANLVFTNIKLSATINTNIFLKTVNAGMPDGDLLYAYNSRNATINFYDDDGNFVETYNP